MRSYFTTRGGAGAYPLVLACVKHACFCFSELQPEEIRDETALFSKRINNPTFTFLHETASSQKAER